MNATLEAMKRADEAQAHGRLLYVVRQSMLEFPLIKNYQAGVWLLGQVSFQR